MSISSTTSRDDYVGNGSANVYSYTFYIIKEEDLLVTVADLSGVETTLVLGVDYSVSGVGLNAGGAVTLINASQAWLTAGNLTTGFALTLRRVREIVQETDIRNQGSYFPADIEDTMDQLCMTDQQQQDEIDRSLKAPETDTPTPLYLPPVAQRALQVLGFDSSGLPIPGGTFSDIANAQANAAAAAASASSASGSAGAASASAATAQAAAASIIWQKVVFKTFSDSPITLDHITDRAALYVIDTSGGPVVVNLPKISTIAIPPPFLAGIKKETGDGNAITINAFSGDNIDGSSSIQLVTVTEGVALTASPSVEWVAALFGAVSGTPLDNSVSTIKIVDGAVTRAKLNSNAFIAPTVQKFLSGSGTYTKPANVLYIKVKMVGGGGGGGGGGAGGSGGNGGNTTFGTSLLVANGGQGGGTGGGLGGTGGSASLGTGPLGIALTGGSGTSSSNVSSASGRPNGGCGAPTPFGGAGGGGYNAVGFDAIANSGSGGGGASVNTGTSSSGAGGGAGGFVDALINSPSSTYAYSIGSAGAAGTAGSNAYAGGIGATGSIIIEEHYQ